MRKTGGRLSKTIGNYLCEQLQASTNGSQQKNLLLRSSSSLLNKYSFNTQCALDTTTTLARGTELAGAILRCKFGGGGGSLGLSESPWPGLRGSPWVLK